jgi:hypothetical protein
VLLLLNSLMRNRMGHGLALRASVLTLRASLNTLNTLRASLNALCVTPGGLVTSARRLLSVMAMRLVRKPQGGIGSRSASSEAPDVEIHRLDTRLRYLLGLVALYLSFCA